MIQIQIMTSFSEGEADISFMIESKLNFIKRNENGQVRGRQGGGAYGRLM